ncbi:unnamed protein product [Phytophthora fragariaefolia]|uniref:Unnamed protein product n=1 Tax=Phytophthora fragariaefolia TaxID=1490495 RepID=A0A9W7D2B2_9STRA|nr:unnamed protein product [Phytophthora fragariaefolia]
MADRMDAKLVASSPSNRPSSSGTANFRTEEIRDALCRARLTRSRVLQKQGQKLLAALNLPQVGAIHLLPEDHVGTSWSFFYVQLQHQVTDAGADDTDGPGLFTIELNERVYTIKARSHDEAAFWVDALLWRQAGGVVTQKSPDVTKQKVGNAAAVPTDQLDSVHSSAASTTASTTSSMHVEMASKQHVDVAAANPDDVGKDGAPCAACCVVQ